MKSSTTAKGIMAAMAAMALSIVFASGEVSPAREVTLSPGERPLREAQGTRINPEGEEILVTTKCFRFNGEPVVTVMGEMHFSRVPEAEWRDYVRKMKAGGVNILATYVFWNHHEETEGEFNFTGIRNLDAFLQVCDREKMPVVLRIGPWCHGEVRNGGFPDWLVERLGAETRRLKSVDAEYMAAVEKFWRAMFAQVGRHLWKAGGCVVGCQLENECRGPWKYFQALKDLAREIGFDVPFYTRTGWPAMRDTPKYGELLPLYGDYTDGHWGRGNEVSPGAFRRIWRFSSTRSSENIATEMISADVLGKDEKAVAEYPFLTCELGGGMSYAYHRRVEIFPRDTYSIAIVKLGSGSNMIGYYMYASGTNPADAKTFLNECQNSPYTHNNDLPPLSYDYQSPISEWGETEPVYRALTALHSFCRNFGADFALEAPEFFDEHHTRRGPFHFYCDYNRVLNPTGRAYILPENWKTRLGTVKSATAQPVEWRGDTLIMMKVPGLEPKVEFAGEPFAVEFIENSLVEAEKEYERKKGAKGGAEAVQVLVRETKKAGEEREITIGNGKVAQMPSEDDWMAAAEFELELPDGHDNDMLEIDWLGDVARLYVDGQFVADQFYSGKSFKCGLWRYETRGKKLVFKVLPWGDSPLVYVQAPNRPVEKGAKVVSARLRKREN